VFALHLCKNLAAELFIHIDIKYDLIIENKLIIIFYGVNY